MAFDVETGALCTSAVFEVANVENKNALNSHASPTPVVEPGHLYVHFGTYGTACINTETYEERWRREDINCDHMEGPGSSPILVGDLLVFHVDGGDVQYVTALGKRTGETVWRTDRSIDLSKMQKDIRKAFCTPIVAELDGVEVLVSPGAHAAMAYDVRTGEATWRVRYKGFSLASRPMFDGERVYIATGFMRACSTPSTAGSGDVTDEAVAWKWRRNVPKMPSPLLLGDRLMVDDNCATCGHRDGRGVWRQRLGGEHCSTPLCSAIGSTSSTGAARWLAPMSIACSPRTNWTPVYGPPAVVGTRCCCGPRPTSTESRLQNKRRAPARPDLRAIVFVVLVVRPARAVRRRGRLGRFRGPNGAGVAASGRYAAEVGPSACSGAVVPTRP